MPDERPPTDEDISQLMHAALLAMQKAGWDLPAIAAAFVATGHGLVAANRGEAAADRWLAEMTRWKVAAGTDGGVVQCKTTGVH